MQIQYWGYLTAKYYSIKRSASIMSFPGCLNAFLPTQIHIKSSSWRHHNTWREKLESFELLLHNGNLATLDTLGFPSIKSHEHEWLQVTLKPVSGFCSYWWSKGRSVSLSLLFWQFKKEDREFQLPRNLVQMMEYPTGQSDFEGNIDGVVSIKEY